MKYNNRWRLEAVCWTYQDDSPQGQHQELLDWLVTQWHFYLLLEVQLLKLKIIDNKHDWDFKKKSRT